MEGFLGRLLSFDKMMAGSIVKILYYVGLIALTLWTIYSFFSKLFSGEIMPALISLVTFAVGVLLFRVICEIYIVLFRISDNLAALRKMKEAETGTASTPDT